MGAVGKWNALVCGMTCGGGLLGEGGLIGHMAQNKLQVIIQSIFFNENSSSTFFSLTYIMLYDNSL